MGTAIVTSLDRLVSRRAPAVVAIREGDTVVTQDGVLGCVDRLVRSEAQAPAYLVVRTGRTLRRRFPVVPVSLVAGVDSRRRQVELHGRRKAICSLPETLPLVL